MCDDATDLSRGVCTISIESKLSTWYLLNASVILLLYPSFNLPRSLGATVSKFDKDL